MSCKSKKNEGNNRNYKAENLYLQINKSFNKQEVVLNGIIDYKERKYFRNIKN